MDDIQSSDDRSWAASGDSTGDKGQNVAFLGLAQNAQKEERGYGVPNGFKCQCVSSYERR